MALIMPTPIKDKKSGIYYLRVRVPVDLVAKYGQAEVSKSLRTREPSEAKERFAAEYAVVQKRWAALRAKPEPLPLKRIVSLAGRVYDNVMASLENEPGETVIWQQVQRLNSQAGTDDAKLRTVLQGSLRTLKATYQVTARFSCVAIKPLSLSPRRSTRSSQGST
ncbi:DUF6538 domain-containing protein [Sulfitobacter sp. JL08]|uniref:DUF6538 domain-containing protein n=1 Tax=Sulfitobacter sp. JL08 TaxID=2070369 RepID=UPI0013B37B4E|nr:DUF6538 domain-containing protein [Sulfitobacter sp. JL08]